MDSDQSKDKSSLDQLVDARLDHTGDLQAQGRDSPGIDDQLDLGQLLHRGIGRPRPFENPCNIIASLAKIVPGAGAIAHETAIQDKYAIRVERWNFVALSQLQNVLAIGIKDRKGAD